MQSCRIVTQNYTQHYIDNQLAEPLLKIQRLEEKVRILQIAYMQSRGREHAMARDLAWLLDKGRGLGKGKDTDKGKGKGCHWRAAAAAAPAAAAGDWWRKGGLGSGKGNGQAAAVSMEVDAQGSDPWAAFMAKQQADWQLSGRV